MSDQFCVLHQGSRLPSSPKQRHLRLPSCSIVRRRHRVRPIAYTFCCGCDRYRVCIFTRHGRRPLLTKSVWADNDRVLLALRWPPFKRSLTPFTINLLPANSGCRSDTASITQTPTGVVVLSPSLYASNVGSHRPSFPSILDPSVTPLLTYRTSQLHWFDFLQPCSLFIVF